MNRLKTKLFTQDLSAGALAESLSDDFRDLKVVQVTFSFSGDCSHTQTLTLNSAGGTSFDALIVTNTLTSETVYVWRGSILIANGDSFDVGCTNVGGAETVSVSVYYATEFDI